MAAVLIVALAALVATSVWVPLTDRYEARYFDRQGRQITAERASRAGPLDVEGPAPGATVASSLPTGETFYGWVWTLDAHDPAPANGVGGTATTVRYFRRVIAVPQLVATHALIVLLCGALLPRLIRRERSRRDMAD